MKKENKKDKKKLDHWDKLFLNLENIQKKSESIDFTVLRENLQYQQANVMDKMQLALMFNQAENQRKYTIWFIILTIVLILVSAFQVYLNFFCK